MMPRGEIQRDLAPGNVSGVSPAITAQMRERALESQAARKASAPPHIDNALLYSGNPLTYYCADCGWVCDIFPEDFFLAKARTRCAECYEIHLLGWKA